jgi:hypothetical protein
MNADPTSADSNEVDVDVLVVGSGAAGFAAALTAQLAGLQVLLIEKAPVFGGTSALSGGGVWAPGNRFSRAKGQGDTQENALAYLQSVCGNNLNIPVARNYLRHCVEAVEYLEANSGLVFGPNPIPDYRAELPGGVDGGRSLRAARFDGRQLGPWLDRLRPPLASTTIFGGMMVSAEDLPDLFRAGRSLPSAFRVLGMLRRHVHDRLRNGRVTRLANGNGMIAALASAYLKPGGQLWLDASLTEFHRDGDRVASARVRSKGRDILVRTACGVILAAGGSPHGPLSRTYPHVRSGHPHVSLAPVENSGDTLDIARAVGAHVRTDLAEPAALTPVSLAPVAGSICGFPHFFDRSKPGFIAVSQRGVRFGNETDEYHVFGRALIDEMQLGGRIFLLCDHKALRRYGVGPVPPFPGRTGPWIRSGYLKRGQHLDDLARQIGCAPDTLAQTVRRYNSDAAQGTDSEFGRGTTIYNRFIGDASANNAPLSGGPYYAVELFPGDLGTFVGLAADENGQALDSAGNAIEGLYVAGNDAASFMGGSYPAAGITLGPGLTFGYLAARHAAGLGESHL